MAKPRTKNEAVATAADRAPPRPATLTNDDNARRAYDHYRHVDAKTDTMRTTGRRRSLFTRSARGDCHEDRYAIAARCDE